MSQNLLTVKDVADLLSVKKSYIYELSRKDRIPRIKIGKYVRFDLDEVLAWVREGNGSKS